jgi:predicted N-formylglutamate amidohydrolase
VKRLPLIEPDEPSPVEVEGAERLGPFVIVCDHAGRALPRVLGDLGLSDEQLSAHIAWDIGAAGVARRLARDLDSPLFLQRYSRLVIDCNRPLGAADSIPSKSGGISIPANQQLSHLDVAERARAIFQPYHERIEAALEQRGSYVLVSIHSFTPELYGVKRPFHAGVLYERDTRLAAPLLELLRAEDGLVVGDNEPYAASRATDYAIIEYGERRGAPYVELEVRQDLVADDAGQALWAERFARVLRHASATLLNASAPFRF